MTISISQPFNPIAAPRARESSWFVTRPRATIFAVAMVMSVLYVLSPWYLPHTGLVEEERIALHLARGEGFLSPVLPGPNAPATSWCPPLYPALMAVVYRLFGIRSKASVEIIVLFNHVC